MLKDASSLVKCTDWGDAAATGCIMDVILVVIVARYLAATIPLVMVAAYFLQRFYLHTSRQVWSLQQPRLYGYGS